MAEVIEVMSKPGGCVCSMIAKYLGRKDESDKDCDTMNCHDCYSKWFGIFSDMVDQEKTEAVSAAMERTMAEQMAEWAVESGLPAFREEESFKAWLDRCFLPRPLFEGGEPVQFEDKVLHRETGETVTVFNMHFFSDGDFILGFRGGKAGSSLYDKGERIKRPAPKALGADGLPIEVGDTVWHEDGTKLRVKALLNRFQDNGAGAERLIEVDYIDGPTTWGEVCALSLSHTPPDTQERIDADARKHTYDYWDCDGYGCKECPSKVDGETPMEHFGVGNCSEAKCIELLRRQRELDARKGGAE